MITEKQKVADQNNPTLWASSLGLHGVRGWEREEEKEEGRSLHSRLINLNTDLRPRMGCKMLIGWFIIRRWRNAPQRESLLFLLFCSAARVPRRASSLAKTTPKTFFSWFSGSLGWGHWNWQDTCVPSAYVRHSRFGIGSYDLRSNLGLPRL